MNPLSDCTCDPALLARAPNGDTIDFKGFCRTVSSNAESFRKAIDVGITVVSRINRRADDGVITLLRLATSMLCANDSSTPSSPCGVRQCDRLDGSIGGAVCKYILPVKTCQ